LLHPVHRARTLRGLPLSPELRDVGRARGGLLVGGVQRVRYRLAGSALLRAERRV